MFGRGVRVVLVRVRVVVVGREGWGFGGGGLCGVGVVVLDEGPRLEREEEEGRPCPRACWAGLRVLVLSLSVIVMGGPRGGYACPFVNASPDLLLALPFVRGAGTEAGAKVWEGVIGEGMAGV